MNKCRILSGDQLIDKGITRINGSLPELGLKDVVPNGSWLEQKQIQCALEARKHLVQVDRIEKCHALSHAEWREDLCLAEMKQILGGHWQFIGHNVGRQRYLLPEEALYLMESNCLLLKHNEVTVSLQKAYALLLKDSMTILRYKVYAHLSRLGYKVFRHKIPEKSNSEMSAEESDKNENLGDTNEDSNSNVTQSSQEGYENPEAHQGNNLCMDLETPEDENKINENTNTSHDDNFENENLEIANKETHKNVVGSSEPSDSATNVDHLETKEINEHDSEMRIENQTKNVDSEEDENQTKSINFEEAENQTDSINNVEDAAIVNMDSTGKIDSLLDKGTKDTNEYVLLIDQNDLPTTSSTVPTKQILLTPASCFSKLQGLRMRQILPCDAKQLHKSLEAIPDFTKDTVTINAPEEQHIPRNIFLNNSSYTLKVENIKSRVVPNNNLSRTTYSISDNEVSGAHVRRVKEAYHRNLGVFPSYYNQYFVRPQPQSRPFAFWRPPQENMTFYPLHMIFHRQFAPNVNFSQRHSLPRNVPRYFRPNPTVTNMNINDENINRKRVKEARSAQQTNFNSIKKLAAKLKQMILQRNVDQQNIIALHRVIHAYNTTYKTKLRLTNDFDLIDDVETITLEDDDETKSKKPRLASDENLNSYGDNLNRLTEIALKLKTLAESDTSTRHKRAMSNAIKTFNKSYKADVYMNRNYEIIDRKQIILDSSSDSDCTVEEPVKKAKKLRNPFNVLKQLSDKSRSIASTSKESQPESNTALIDNKIYNDELLKIFTSDWLPPVEDFGRAEICKYSTQRDFNVKKEEFILEFIENHPIIFNNWWEAKVAYFDNLEVSNEQYNKMQNNELITEEIGTGMKPIISPEDSADMKSILKKLGIIKNDKEVTECSLKIDFDVYNRDVPNFRKTEPPVPHYRIVCLCETSSFPSCADIISLHSKYDDEVTVLFAIVGTSSVSFIQINPSDIPIYFPTSDIDMP